MHGGARGSGAPVGNRNAFKDGTYTREATEQRREMAERLREAQRIIRESKAQEN